MPVKININPGNVTAKVENAFDKGLAQLSELILADCNEYCKYREGGLITSSLTHSRPQEGKLIWETPYARRQYWSIQTAVKDKNPRATWKWCEFAKAANLDKWRRQAQALMRANL